MIQSNQRVFICGKTRSGKTTAARILASKLNRLVVFDPKNLIDNAEWKLEDVSAENFSALEEGEPARIRISPPVENPELFWTEWLYKIFNIGDLTLYIDEMYLIVEPGARPPSILAAFWTQGAGRNIGTWVCTQRPTWLPLFAISEAEHWFLFRLNMKQDRQRMAEFMTDAVLRPIRDTHGFYYMSVDADSPRYISDILKVGERSKKHGI